VPTIFKVQATAKIGSKVGTTTTGADSITETAVLSPENRLEKLVNVYAYSYPHRLFRVDSSCLSITALNGESFTWEAVETNLDERDIRPLVFFDLIKGARFIPMFAELSKGRRVELYKKFMGSTGVFGTAPEFPDRKSANYEQEKAKYWKNLSDGFTSQTALDAVEKATGSEGGLIQWIDFRIVAFDAGKPIAIHLHLSPNGQFPTGTFAYQLIRRGENHGVRILGTLKKGQDVNVLAIYEC
jgi:hypothetical protein